MNLKDLEVEMKYVKKIALSIALGVAACLLTSCFSVEPDLASEEQNSQIQIEKQSLDEIWETWDSAIQDDYENVSLDSSIKLEKPEEIGTMIFVQATLSDEEQDKIFAEFVPNRNKKLDTYLENMSPPGPEYEDPDTGEHLGVGTNGFLFYMKKGELAEAEQDEPDETIFLNREYKNKSFRLRDGKISLDEAVRLAEEMETRWEDTIPNVYTHRLCKVEVYPSAENAKVKNLVFSFEHVFKGVNVLTTRRTTESGEEKPLSVNYIPYYNDKVIVSSVQGAEYINSNAGIVKIKSENPSEKIVTLRLAIQLFSAQMAGYHMNEIKHIELSYRFVNNEGEDCRFLAGTEYEAKPCWVLWINEEKNAEEFGLVDCDTGEVDYIKNY